MTKSDPARRYCCCKLYNPCGAAYGNAREGKVVSLRHSLGTQVSRYMVASACSTPSGGCCFILAWLYQNLLIDETCTTSPGNTRVLLDELAFNSEQVITISMMMITHTAPEYVHCRQYWHLVFLFSLLPVAKKPQTRKCAKVQNDSS